MRRRLLLSGTGLLAALLAVALTRGASRGAAPPAPLRAARPPAPRAGVPTALPEPPAPPSRNVFRYLDEASAPPPTSVLPHAALPDAPPAAPPAVRLVGFLRGNEGLKAALSILGEVVVCAAGEQVSGYTVVSVDEEEGVRVRAPDGAEISLTSGR